MRNDKDQKSSNSSRSFLNKMAELITSGESPSEQEAKTQAPTESRLDQYQNSVNKQSQDIDNRMLENAIDQINSAFNPDQATQDSTPSDNTAVRYLSNAINEPSPLTDSFINEHSLNSEQYSNLVSRLIERISTELSTRNLSSEMEKWQDLYENFRIGLQLGFRYFSEALMESGEDIPDQDVVGSPWNWHTWETMVGNLLNNFDQYCAKEINRILKSPGNLIEEALIHAVILKFSEQKLSGPLLIDAVYGEMEAEVIERVENLLAKLQMSDKLVNTIHNPGTIANDFETYLWANYIDKQNIGNYGHSLRDRLFGVQRRAPSGEVTRRLQFLKVAEADELDKIVNQRVVNGRLKKLNDWAREHVCEFNTWEKICYDSTRFLPRTIRR